VALPHRRRRTCLRATENYLGAALALEDAELYRGAPARLVRDPLALDGETLDADALAAAIRRGSVTGTRAPGLAEARLRAESGSFSTRGLGAAAGSALSGILTPSNCSMGSSLKMTFVYVFQISAGVMPPESPCSVRA
jgi:hypothetical protein